MFSSYNELPRMLPSKKQYKVCKIKMRKANFYLKFLLLYLKNLHIHIKNLSSSQSPIVPIAMGIGIIDFLISCPLGFCVAFATHLANCNWIYLPCCINKSIEYQKFIANKTPHIVAKSVAIRWRKKSQKWSGQ